MSNVPPKYFVIHAAATFPSMDVDAKWIDKIHRERGFNSIGYHYFIKRDGTVERGRPDSQQGAHVLGFNQRTIGICMAGGLKEGTQTPEDNFTGAQYKSLTDLLDRLHDKYPDARIKGHNGFHGHHSRGCPCFDWRSFAHNIESRWDNEFIDDEDDYNETSFGSNVTITQPSPEVEAPTSSISQRESTSSKSIFDRVKNLFGK